MTKSNEIEVRRVRTGLFHVYKNGERTTLSIMNGSAGVSGYGKNTYLIWDEATNSRLATGSLAQMKEKVGA